MPLEFNNLVKVKVDQKNITRIFSRFLKISKLPKSTMVSVALVGELEMKKLNRQWRGRSSVTDVLSFSSRESEKFPRELDLGEVIICWPVAARQAKERRHSADKEIEILLTHGLAHLAGYEHGTEKEAGEMGRLEKAIIN